jgi:drug/metabolite transporter (DMT)-like permease
VKLADLPPATAAFFRCAYAVPFLALIARVERGSQGPRPARQVRLARVAGVLFAVDLVAWNHTIEWVGAGLATVLSNTQVVFVALAAWLLWGERPRTSVLVAMPAVLIGAVLVSGVLGVPAFGRNPTLGVITGEVTAVSYAAFILVLRRGNADPHRPAGNLLGATSTAAVAALAMGVPLGEVNLLPTWPGHVYILGAAFVSQVVGWLLVSHSLSRLPASLTSLALLIQPVGAVLLGSVFLREQPSLVQWLGAGCILAGLLLATIRSGQPVP